MCRGIPTPPPYPPPHLGTTVSFQDPCDGFLTVPLLPSLHPSQFSTQLLGRLSKVSEILLLFSWKLSPLAQTGSCSPFHSPGAPSALTLASPCDLLTGDPPLDRSASAAPPAIPEQPRTRSPQGLCTRCPFCPNAPSPHVSTAYSLTSFTPLPNSSFSWISLFFALLIT